MKKVATEFAKLPPLVVMAGALSVWQAPVVAQDAGGQPPLADAGAHKPEEVVVVGRSLNASENLVQERLEDPSVVDTIGAEAISRLGDSTVAASLRRVPGLSLVSDKYVYIRGLGERYSSTSLNGAEIPSPDLTRNVIPLDIFPTSVVESVRVQKAWSPDLPANFGGGGVNVRTKGVPERFQLNFEVSSGTNTQNSGKALTYPGGSDDALGTDDGTRAMSAGLKDALARYQGNLSVQNILANLRGADAAATFADAQQVNRSLALDLNRHIGVRQESIDPDLGIKAGVGNRFVLGNDLDFGFALGGTYDNVWRESTRLSRSFAFPQTRTDTEDESTHQVNISATANLGLDYLGEHKIATTSLFLRNTDDETAIRDFFNENRDIPSGRGFRNYRFKFEERELTSHQIRGDHDLGPATRAKLPGFNALLGWLPEQTHLSWFYTDSKATTDIPNEVTIVADTRTDRDSGETLSSSVASQTGAADYRFTELEDQVRDYGWSFTLPLEIGSSTLELRGGTRHSQKARTYRQTQFSLGALGADPAVLAGSLDEVFADEHILDPANGFVFSRTGSNNQSYIAATMTDSAFGIADWTFYDRWRISAGARWEDYRQVALDWNPYGSSQTAAQVSTNPDVLRRGTFASGDWYPAASLTYTSDWLAQTFQLRFGWSRTVIRPDLREITDASYIDPITDILTRGNSGIVPAGLANYDVRAEWRFAGGDSLSVTLFDKEIDHPIEFFESAASDTTIAREILNAESGTVRGVELEGLKQLGFLGAFAESLFVQGNLTVQDSELVAGPRADAPTNARRKMAGASDYVLNMMLGFDSPDGKHTVSLIYNVFGERLFTAGRNGAPDAFEQPFNSLDFTYTWYPTQALTFKLKAQNLLDERIEIQREDVVTFEEDPGSTFALSAAWKF